MIRRAFQILIFAVLASAVMGIFALLAGDFGKTELRILLTAMSVAGASILAMACGAARERNRGGWFVPVGIGASLLGFAMVVTGIWAFQDGGPGDYWKIAGTLVTVGIFASHAALLRVPRLSRRFAWVHVATVVCGAILAQMVVSLIWGADWDEDTSARMIGVLAILVSAGTILVPVFARLSRDEFAAATDDADAPPACPHCGKRLPAGFVAWLVDRERAAE